MILLADLGRAREADLADSRIGDKAPTDDRAPAWQDLEDVLRNPRFEGKLSDADRCQRREVGRLEDDRVARGKRRSEAPRGDWHREVPGHDDPDDADRLAEGDIHAPGYWDLAPEQPLRCSRVVRQHVADVARLPTRVRDRVTRIRHLEPCQLLVGRADGLRETPEKPGSIDRRDGTPSRERGCGASDRLVGSFRVDLVDRRDRLLRGGVDDRTGHAHSRSNPR